MTETTTRMSPGQQVAMLGVLSEIIGERERQHAKWGEQNHTNGTGPSLDIIEDIGHFPGNGNASLQEDARDRTDALARVPDRVTYAHILTEEWAEAMAEEDPVRLREELIQVAAVCAAWVEKIDREAA